MRTGGNEKQLFVAHVAQFNFGYRLRVVKRDNIEASGAEAVKSAPQIALR